MTQKELDSAIEVLYEKAKETAAKGEIPISAVLLFPDGAVYAEGNAVEEKDNPLEHAEIRVINRAIKDRGRYLKDGVLLVSLEPCLMCLGAIVKAGIPILYYILDDPKLGSLSHYHAFVDDVLKINRIGSSKFSKLMKDFFYGIRRK